jgi:hypothetical protein
MALDHQRGFWFVEQMDGNIIRRRLVAMFVLQIFHYG